MLNLKKTIAMQGICTINDVQAETLTVTINTDNLEAVTITERQLNIPLCEDNKEELQKDAVEFRDAVYAIIDQLTGEDANREVLD